MVSRTGTIFLRGLSDGFSSKFCEGSRVLQLLLWSQGTTPLLSKNQKKKPPTIARALRQFIWYSIMIITDVLESLPRCKTKFEMDQLYAEIELPIKWINPWRAPGISVELWKCQKFCIQSYRRLLELISFTKWLVLYRVCTRAKKKKEGFVTTTVKSTH